MNGYIAQRRGRFYVVIYEGRDPGKPTEGKVPMAHDDDRDLDDLIEQITVDAYGDEGYWSFLQALTDDAERPFHGTIADADVRVEAFDFDGNERRGITARVTRDGTTHIVSLLDVHVPDDAAPTAFRIVAAYRRWLGIQ